MMVVVLKVLSAWKCLKTMIILLWPLARYIFKGAITICVSITATIFLQRLLKCEDNDEIVPPPPSKDGKKGKKKPIEGQYVRMHPNVQPTNRKKKNFSDYEHMTDDEDDDDDDESNDEDDVEIVEDEPDEDIMETATPEQDVLTVDDLVVSLFEE